MAAPPHSAAILLLSLSAILILLPAGHAQNATAPTPAAAGPINITGILDKAGQFTTFIRLLNHAQAGDQIDNQVNNSRDGMTVFAPTDNAFNNLPAGVLNGLTDNQQVQLVQYCICPKFYSLSDLQTVSNPVRTQASDQDGQVFGLYFSGAKNQVNISNGNVSFPINNQVRTQFPLAVYELDGVLIPKEFSEAKPPTPAPAPPVSGNRSGGRPGGGAVAPSTGNPAGSGAGKMNGMGLVGWVWLLSIGLFA